MVLQNLDGLAGMRCVKDRVYIRLNSLITNVDELENIDSVGADLIVAVNSSLINC